MYTCKVKTFTEKEYFSMRQHPAKDGRKDGVFIKQKSQNEPPQEPTGNPEKIGCIVCKKLQEALEEHCRMDHAKDARSVIFPPLKQGSSGKSTDDRGNAKASKIQQAQRRHFQSAEETIIEIQREKSASEKSQFREQAGRKKIDSKFGKSKTEKLFEKSMPEKCVFKEKTTYGKTPKKMVESKVEKSDNTIKEGKPKMRQVSLLSMIQNKKEIGSWKIQEPITENGDEQRSTKSVVIKTSTSREPSISQTPPNLKPFKKENCHFLRVVDNFGRYPCVWCKKSFSTHFNLTRHVLKHKENKNKESFICAECGLKFDRKDSLKRHFLTHKNDRPHVCSICRRRFKHKYHLNVHVKLNRCFKQDRLKYY